MKKKLVVLFIIAINIGLFAEEEGIVKDKELRVVEETEEKQDSEPQYECFIGSSMFMLGNLLQEESPSYYQLNFGYQFSPKDIIIFEAIIWTYYEPIGIPWGSSGEAYPGKVSSYGIGVGYQRFLWKNLYTTIQATPFMQQYHDTEGNKIQNGFQLWLQLRLGYRFEFFKDRFFLEPSVVCNYWPINTNVPESFEDVESEWPSYFLFEPGLHFGFKF